MFEILFVIIIIGISLYLRYYINQKIKNKKYLQQHLKKLEKEEQEERKTKENIEKKEISNKTKGTLYEIEIGKHYKNLGYKVHHNGIANGYNDKKVDLVAYKNNNMLLIQCKDWNKNGKYKITDKHIKAFQNGCNHYLACYKKQSKNQKIKKIFCCSANIYEDSAKEEASKNNIETLIIT